MELISKLSHGTKSQHYPNLPILDHLKFVLTLLLAFTESLLILLKYDVVFHFFPISCIVLCLVYEYYLKKPGDIFLVDFSCFRPPSHCRIPIPSYIEHLHLYGFFDKENVDVMTKILHNSGFGQETCLPLSYHFIPPRPTHPNSLDETQMVLFPVMEDLLTKSKISPSDIDILIVNCSGFCPSPSLSTIIVNKFKLRPDVKTFTISGMGCSASMLAVELANSLLSLHKESNAVVLSTEVLTMGWYKGNDRAKLVLNCLFRMGGAGILLSNKKKVRHWSKYKLIWTMRDQRAYNDRAYKSAFREEDADGLTGVTLRKDILEVASDMIRAQLTALGSSMLPITEKVKFVTSVLRKKFFNKATEIYVPNFKTIVKHFCLPVSGKPLIREIGKGLRLGEKDMEAALATLHRFGNQSSSSLWYELAYIEAKERVKKGERVWMLGMGSGPKCTSVVLECIRPIIGESIKGPWADCIGRYPFSAFENEKYY